MVLCLARLRGQVRGEGIAKTDVADLCDRPFHRSYYAPIGIGVPAQYMNCILDTG